MISSNFGKKFIMGGLNEINDINVKIRKLQINDGVRLHTCNDYGNSLEVIKIASTGIQNKVKIISKIYYKYPDPSNRRFRPLIDQIKEQKNRLDFIPMEWDIQLCCYVKFKELISKNAKLFFKYINESFGIKNVYLEYYPVYNYTVENIYNLNKSYKGQITFGFLGYDNILNGVFQENISKKLDKSSIPLIYVGILGFGNQNENFFKELDKKNVISLNLIYFLKNYYKYSNLLGITQASSLKHYENLKEIYLKLIKEKSQINSNSFSKYLINKAYYSSQYDHYGSYFSLIYLLRKPKLIISILKRKLLIKFKSQRFNNNFFGNN